MLIQKEKASKLQTIIEKTIFTTRKAYFKFDRPTQQGLEISQFSKYLIEADTKGKLILFCSCFYLNHDNDFNILPHFRY